MQAKETRRAVFWTVATLLAWLAVDALVFRSGWYNRWLEPNSSTGQVEARMAWLRQVPHGAIPEAIVFGDSRVAHALWAPVAAAASGNKLRFWNFGIPGTLPRDWYYMLRDADPDRRRFSAVVLGLDQYSDEDYVDVYADRTIDVSFLAGRLRLGDCGEFASSMLSPRSRAQALAGCLLKGIAQRGDVRDLLSNWTEHLARAKTWREHSLRDVDAFPGVDANLRGLRADWEHHVLTFPPGTDDTGRALIQATVMPHWPAHTGATTRYRGQWLTKIFDLYRGSSTRIILLELPRAPLPKPESATPRGFLNSALPRAGVIALDAATFRDLERPELFADGLHLNRQGRAIFSERLGRILGAL
jgi:hypothetical protein